MNTLKNILSTDGVFIVFIIVFSYIFFYTDLITPYNSVNDVVRDTIYVTDTLYDTTVVVDVKSEDILKNQGYIINLIKHPIKPLINKQ